MPADPGLAVQVQLTLGLPELLLKLHDSQFVCSNWDVVTSFPMVNRHRSKGVYF